MTNLKITADGIFRNQEFSNGSQRFYLITHYTGKFQLKLTPSREFIVNDELVELTQEVIDHLNQDKVPLECYFTDADREGLRLCKTFYVYEFDEDIPAHTKADLNDLIRDAIYIEDDLKLCGWALVETTRFSSGQLIPDLVLHGNVRLAD